MSGAASSFDPLAVTLAGVHVVEASAGTGKTHAIGSLFVRLVVEERLLPENVLVVTFTNAATAELRERIRGRLVRALDAFEGRTSDDREACALRDRSPDRESAVRHLRAALRAFDLAAIHTIHGFCQRALAEHAFACGVDFETELVADDRPLVDEAVRDFWRRRIATAPPRLVEYARARGWSPAALAGWARGHVERPWLEVRAPPLPSDPGTGVDAFEDALARCRELWRGARGDVIALLAGGALDRRRYRPDRLERWAQAMDEWLAAPPPDLAAFEYADRLTASGVAAAARAGSAPPTHPFLEAFEDLLKTTGELATACDRVLCALRGALVEECNRSLHARKRRERLRAYPDLLLELVRALRRPGGDVLAARLRGRYAAALVDEFQDTDPVQLEIFRRVYAHEDRPVFLVGDPKQAIYAFRGADVFAYLDARTRADEAHALTENWRSEPALVDAVNALFARSRRPFVVEGIGFEPAVAAPEAPREPLSVEGDGDGSPLRLWLLERGEDGKVLGKERARERIANACADEIARLLSLGAAGRARIGTRVLAGADVAVLVPTHRHARIVRDALGARGVAAVEQSQQSVFASEEALDLERLMMAVAEPGRVALVRAALAGALLGAGGAFVAALASDERALDRELERFERWHRLWAGHGFSRMFRTVLQEAGVPARLLSLPAGERRLTNVLHVAELLQRAETAEHLGVEALVDRLAERRTADAGGAEESQLRLESDEHLVRIVTVHRSKGLQYPIVFCPYLWDEALRSRAGAGAGVSFHDPAAGNRAVLLLSVDPSPHELALAAREELAEQVRLAYVALTRARNRCYAVWGAARGAEISPLGWLLHAPERGAQADVEALEARVKGLDDATLRTELEQAVAEVPGAVEIARLPPDRGLRFVPEAPEPAGLAARAFRGVVHEPWTITSYSALAAARDADDPDHDAWVVAPAAAGGGEGGIHGFPRGARAGTCLHAVFERVDFAGDAAARAPVVAAALAEHGFDAAWVPAVTEAVRRTLATRLVEGESWCLADVPARRRLAELEFHYPVAGLDPDALADLVARHPVAPGRLRPRPEALGFDPVAGFLKGFVDLVVEAGGRYWILDWKSNWLGPADAAYEAAALAPVIEREAYWLQYLLYTIAVHRHLRRCVPDYAYARHFGGVLYLFMRGIDPRAGPARGVWFDRPDAALVAALDRTLAGAVA